MNADLARTVHSEANQKLLDKDVLLLAINRMCFWCAGFEENDPELSTKEIFHKCKSIVQACTNRECPLNHVRFGQPTKGRVNIEMIGKPILVDASAVDIKRRKRIKYAKQWTAHNDGTLMELGRKGYTVRQIAVMMRRKEDDVIKRMDMLMRESAENIMKELL